MAAEPSDLAVEEYRALRSTIRERGTTRLVVTTITFVSWAALLVVVLSLASIPALGLIPLLVLATGFEVVFALHVGVERLGRFLQARYERPDGLPGWEHAAMKVGGDRRARLSVDPLFAWPFCLAAVLNNLAVLAMQDAAQPAEWLAYAFIHALPVARVISARRVAARQRERDLALFL